MDILKNNKICILIILFFIIISFSLNTLQNEFVYDDINLVKQSQEMGSITRIEENIFAYRPVRHLSYMLDYQIFKGTVYGYRLMNIIYHAAAAIFLFLIFNLILSNNIIALLAALIFAIHPAQCESVIYISGRRDVLAGLFFFAAFYLALIFRRKNKSYLYLILSSVAYILGLFSKENVAVLLGVLLSYDIFSNIDYKEQDLTLKNILKMIYNKFLYVIKKYKTQYITFFIITLPFAFFKLFIRVPSYKKALYGGSVTVNFITSIKIFLMYIYKTIFPITLCVDHSYNAVKIPQMFSFVSLFYIIFLIIFIFLLIRLLKKKAFYIFCFLLFFLPLFPVLHIIIPYHEMFAEHMLYISLSGFGLMISHFLYQSLFLKKRGYLFYFLVIGLLIFYSARIIIRNKDWKNSYTLWSAAVKVNPDSAKIHKSLGDAYWSMHRKNEAIQELKKAIKLMPGYTYAHNNLGSIYVKLKEYDKALTNFRIAIQLDPNLLGAYFNIASIHFERGEIEKGIKVIKANQQTFAQDHTFLFAVANLCLKHNILSTAEEEYLKVIEINPAHAGAYANLALIYSQSQRIDKAISLLNKGITLCERSKDYHWLYYKLASNYLKQNKVDLALMHLKNTIKIVPEFAMAYIDIGNIYLNKKNYPESLYYYKHAYNLSPNDIMVLNKIASVLIYMKSYSRAESFINRSISLKPNPEAYLYKSILYAVGQQKESVLNFLKNAISLCKDKKERKLILEEIKKNQVFYFLKNDPGFQRIIK